MKLLSIIVPIYNVEPYVERCLRSLEDQDIPRDDYEIICINDGSPDNCRGVVIRMQKEFNNIILIDQENQGVSQARNNGIDKSCGKYLMFIDPDDYVEKRSFSGILRNADNQLAQVSFLGFKVLNEDETIVYEGFIKDRKLKIYSGIEAYSLERDKGRIDPDRIYAVLLETRFLNCNNLRFLPGVPYLEDGEFITRILCLAERCIFDGHSFYLRTTRPGSATHSNLFYSEKATYGFLMSANNLRRFQQEKDLNNRQREFLNQPIVKFVKLSIDSSLNWKSFKRFLTTVKMLKSLGLRRIKPNGCSRIYFIFGKAFYVSPYLGAIALILYPRVNRLFQWLSAK